MSLLPSSSSALMHVLADCLCDRLAAVPCPGPEAMRPETAPESFVPFLAWGWAVDLWDRDWPVSRKRAITAAALEMHRLKGTEVGIRRYLAYTAARDPLFTVPPQDFFLSAGPADDPAWRRWIESLPEIRFYQVRSPSISAVGVLSDPGDDDLPEICFFAAEPDEETFFAADELLPTEVEYATLVEGTVATAITATRRADPRSGRSGSVIDFRLPGDAGLGAFVEGPGAVDGIDHLGGAPALSQEVSVALGPTIAEGDGWALVDEAASWIQEVQPEAGVYEVVDLIGLMATADFCNDAILDDADSGSGIYQAIRVIRPGLTLPPAANFWNDGRLSMAPYTAEIRVAIPEVVGAGVAHIGVGCLDAIHIAPDADLDDLWFVCDAAAAAQSLRDRVALDLDIPVPSRSLKASRRLGQLSLG